MSNVLLALSCSLALSASNSQDTQSAVRPLTVPWPIHTSALAADLRSAVDRPAYVVPAGVQVTARIFGAMPIPATDPGRTQIRIELVFPLLASNGQAVLLPRGTQLVGQVHLLHGQLLFVDFQTCFLPDGRGIRLPEQAFLLGPGPLLALQDGTPALVTVARPLQMESVGQVR